MCLFTLGGVRVLRMGDVGNAIAPAVVDALSGQVDVLLALTGGHATTALDDRDDAIAAIDPRIIIPMHYWQPRGVLKIEPVDQFLLRNPEAMIRRLEGTSMIVDPAHWPAAPQIVVLNQARLGVLGRRISAHPCAHQPLHQGYRHPRHAGYRHPREGGDPRGSHGPKC